MWWGLVTANNSTKSEKIHVIYSCFSPGKDLVLAFLSIVDENFLFDSLLQITEAFHVQHIIIFRLVVCNL